MPGNQRSQPSRNLIRG